MNWRRRLAFAFVPPEPPPAAFLTPLTLRRYGRLDSGLWTLVGDFRFYSARLGRVITVPAEFVTDLASVPRLPVMYWLCGATADEAAVVHDFLYRDASTSRADADAVLAEAMGVIARQKQETLAVSGAPAWRRFLAGLADDARRGAMWAGVRVGGGSSYKARAGTLTALAPLNPVEAP